LLQETAGRVYKPFARPDWLPGALFASAAVTLGYGWMISTGSIMTIWPMFGIANQLLAVMALALVTTWLVNNGRGRYAPVTVIPMLFVTSTTLSAGALVVKSQASMNTTVGTINAGLTVFVIACVCTVVALAVARWLAVWMGKSPATKPV
jgi:carbon starvation protein